MKRLAAIAWARFRRWWYLLAVGMWRGERAIDSYGFDGCCGWWRLSGQCAWELQKAIYPSPSHQLHRRLRTALCGADGGFMSEFYKWWDETGGGLCPKQGDCYEQHACIVALAAWDAATTTLRASLSRAEQLCETLKQEAQIHAQEARTANATIGKIYQVLTGATGEPGNWNGAEPARRIMRELAEARREVEKGNKYRVICEDYIGLARVALHLENNPVKAFKHLETLCKKLDVLDGDAQNPATPNEVKNDTRR